MPQSFHNDDVPSMPPTLKPFHTPDIKILLLENINQVAVKMLTRQGFEVEVHSKALPEDVLIEKIKEVHAIGIRSKTKLTEKVLSHAKNLLAIGCFCIGTNQVDLEYTSKHAVAVFNSPFSNSRSVAELIIGEIITLSRQLGDRNREMHTGSWNKVSRGCYEIRGKTLGIVGYGHIGSQLSVLAEAMGMNVIFYDVLQLMPLGTARAVSSLDELLQNSDFVTLHVPETTETMNMVREREISLMKPGSFLLNASRGSVVDIHALASALKSGHLAGAAIDVYPQEPLTNGDGFMSELQNCPNTILTPHIGGSTEEAQRMIGVEVATAITKCILNGCTFGAVNYPELDLRLVEVTKGEKTVRVVNTHRNVPGVLKVSHRCPTSNINKRRKSMKFSPTTMSTNNPSNHVVKSPT